MKLDTPLPHMDNTYGHTQSHDIRKLYLVHIINTSDEHGNEWGFIVKYIMLAAITYYPMSFFKLCSDIS